MESPELLKVFVDRFSSKICVGIDARDGRVMTRGWETATPVMAVDLARAVAGVGVERIIYTDIARDGMLSGPNIEQTLGSCSCCERARHGLGRRFQSRRYQAASRYGRAATGQRDCWQGFVRRKVQT